MFCHITANWRGRPLTSYQLVIETIAATTTKTGLTIEAGPRREDTLIGFVPSGRSGGVGDDIRQAGSPAIM